MKPMTITEKILARHAGVKEVAPGELINAKVDIARNDITAPIAISEFRRIGAKRSSIGTRSSSSPITTLQMI